MCAPGVSTVGAGISRTVASDFAVVDSCLGGVVILGGLLEALSSEALLPGSCNAVEMASPLLMDDSRSFIGSAAFSASFGGGRSAFLSSCFTGAFTSFLIAPASVLSSDGLDGICKPRGGICGSCAFPYL